MSFDEAWRSIFEQPKTLMSAPSLGSLILIPAPLSEQQPVAVLDADLPLLRSIRHFVAERARTARAVLKHYKLNASMQELELIENGKHADENELRAFVQQTLQEGKDLGLLSEAGLPAVADPGARVVSIAHELGAKVRPLVGPSSLMLALMASGLGGQRFSVHGYLPVKSAERKAMLKKLEAQARRDNSTQIWIETPYRNDAMFSDCLEALSKQTRLCVATDLTDTSQEIKMYRIAQWRQLSKPDLHKRPSVFLIAS